GEPIADVDEHDVRAQLVGSRVSGDQGKIDRVLGSGHGRSLRSQDRRARVSAVEAMLADGLNDAVRHEVPDGQLVSYSLSARRRGDGQGRHMDEVYGVVR